MSDRWSTDRVSTTGIGRLRREKFLSRRLALEVSSKRCDVIPLLRYVREESGLGYMLLYAGVSRT